MTDEFADRIRDRREALGLTQAQVAERVGRSPSTIGAWEAGRSRPADAATMATLVSLLGLTDVDADGEDVRVELDDDGLTVDLADRPKVNGGHRELNGVHATSNGVGGPVDDAEDEEVQAIEPATVVVAKDRRTAERVAERIPGPTTVGLVESVRTDVDTLYLVRLVATVAALVAFAVIFVWALGHVADELGGIVDTLRAPFSG